MNEEIQKKFDIWWTDWASTHASKEQFTLQRPRILVAIEAAFE